MRSILSTDKLQFALTPHLDFSSNFHGHCLLLMMAIFRTNQDNNDDDDDDDRISTGPYGRNFSGSGI